MNLTLLSLRPAVLWLALCFLLPQTVAAATPVSVKSSRHILDPEDPGRTEFGGLIYLSGIVMRSDSPDFGGFSGIQISADGTRILAVSDKGQWLRAELAYENGRLTGLDDAEISRLLDEDGREIRGRYGLDSEALTAEQPGNLDGPVYVSFEGRHRVWYYSQGIGGKASAVPMPSSLKQAPSNKGIEAFERRADGVLIALTEGWLDDQGNQRGWLIGKDGPQNIRLRREGIFDPTDLEFLPDGDLLILERRYTVMGGPGMQIRRVKADTIKPEAILDGEVLISLATRYGVDNFEGMAVRKNTAGEVIVYLISDNNFNPLQKNLLLMFKLAP